MKAKTGLSTKVNRVLTEFNAEQHDMKKHLAHKAKALHTSMKHVENDRLHEFKTFRKQLEQEKKESHIKTTNQLLQTQQFINECHAHQAELTKEVHG